MYKLNIIKFNDIYPMMALIIPSGIRQRRLKKKCVEIVCIRIFCGIIDYINLSGGRIYETKFIRFEEQEG